MGAVLVAIVLIICIAVVIKSSKKASGSKMADIKKQMTENAKSIEADFNRVGWSAWGYPVHLLDDQIQRMHRASTSEKMELIGYDDSLCIARVRGDSGTEYRIDKQGCSCPDFAKRGLPCKHMYFAVGVLTDN